MKNAYNTSAYGSFAYVYDIFMDIIINHSGKILYLSSCKNFISTHAFGKQFL